MSTDVWVFGNIDLAEDSLPLRILPQLQRQRPDLTFRVRDPMEEWDTVPNPLIVVDTVKGIAAVTVLKDLELFEDAPRVSMHDFDLLAQLQFLKKVGKLGHVVVVGVPPTLQPDEAIRQIAAALPRA
jgi:Ni,Fe-hydrogenase maturation factor